jgi:hypothetical protein
MFTFFFQTLEQIKEQGALNVTDVIEDNVEHKRVCAIDAKRYAISSETVVDPIIARLVN